MKRMEGRKILMVSSNATTEEIRAAYRKLAFIHHPDRKGSTQSMQRVSATIRIHICKYGLNYYYFR